MATKTKQQAEAVDAEVEYAEAEARADELEQRVLDGDETVTHEQITEARSRAGFLGLRREARRRKAELDAHNAHVAAARELANDVVALAPTDPTFAGSAARLETAEAIRVALGALMGALDVYDEKVSAIKVRADKLGLEQRGERFEGIQRGTADSVEAFAPDGQLWAADASWGAKRQEVVRALLRDTLGQFPELSGLSL